MVVTFLGLLVQWCCGERGTLQTYITGLCGECSQCLCHTGFVTAHGVCAFPVYTAQAPGCSVGELSKASPELHALLRSKPLWFRVSGTPQRHRLGWAWIWGPSQVRAAQVTRCLASSLSSGGAGCLITSPVPAAHFPACAVGVTSQVCPVFLLRSWSLAATLPADVNRPGTQEDLVSNWESARSLVEDAVSGAEIVPFCSVCHLPASLPLAGDGAVHRGLVLLWYSLSPMSCEQAWQCLRIEFFMEKFSLSLFFPLPGYPTVWVAVSC